MTRRRAGLLFAALTLVPAFSFAGPAHVEIKKTNTYPEFWVNGKPFFIHAAHFFYPRLPRDLWADSLKECKAMGINTIDLYIPWNWHELKQGELDFDGRTNPRRDAIGLLKIISDLGLKVILRPGPYICAEWKHGGYPAWLLSRPEYKMSERSILEGRYPPLSSLQYTDSEMAAKDWMNNSIHRQHTAKWYKDVASNILKDYSIDHGGPIILIALDDDQPAGSRSNGPYFWAYMKWLRDLFIRNGVSLPMILNPEESPVPSLGDEAVEAPYLWVMTQWYQRSLGLDLSTSSIADIEPRVQSLKTSPEFPPMAVEFNAGFFGLEDDPYGMATQPSNTLTASRILFQNGSKGIVYFPLQDSIYPAGYEIPSVNRYYAWESPLDVSGKRRPKAAEIERNGALIRTYGELLASSHEWSSVGVINPLHAMDFVHASTATIAPADKWLTETEKWLIAKQVANDWVNPEVQPVEQLLRYPILLKPESPEGIPSPSLSVKTLNKLREYVARGGRVIPFDPTSSEKNQILPQLSASARLKSSRWIYGTELVSDSGSLPLGKRDPAAENYGMVMLTNLSGNEVKTRISAADPYDSQASISFGDMTIPAKDSLALPLRIKLSGLNPLSSFLSDADEIYYATAELADIRAAASSLRLNFRAPEPSEAELKINQAPKLVFLNQRKFSDYSYDPARHRLHLRIPRGNRPDYIQTVDLSYVSGEQPPRIPQIKSSMHGDHTPSTEEEPRSFEDISQVYCEFPDQINYQVRPDVVLASSPTLVLVQADLGNVMPVVLSNPTQSRKSVALRWEHSEDPLKRANEPDFEPQGMRVDITPGSSKRVKFTMDPPKIFKADNPIYPAKLSIEVEGSHRKIPVSVLWIPARQAVSYSFDFDRDGNKEIALENSRLRAVIDPMAGGRIIQMISKRGEGAGPNIAAPAGILRDQFALMEPLDTTWGDKKLPSWTRSRVPGFKNRPFSVEKFLHNLTETGAALTCQAPDVAGGAAEIRKSISLGPNESEIAVRYDILLSSGNPNQEFKVHDVVFLDRGAQLWYGQGGRVYKKPLEKNPAKNFQADWIGVRNAKSEWAVGLSTAASVDFSAKGNYAVIEIGFGPMPLANESYAYELWYHYGPDALDSVRRKRP